MRCVQELLCGAVQDAEVPGSAEVAEELFAGVDPVQFPGLGIVEQVLACEAIAMSAGASGRQQGKASWLWISDGIGTHCSRL